MRVTVHQPEHIPWPGFFHKIARADVFVVLDNVQFRKNYFQNRNKIRTPDGWAWITVPVHHSLHTLLQDVQISADERWKKKWLDSLYHAYCKAPYFDEYFPGLKNIINEPISSLSALNLSLIRELCRLLGIKTRFVLASGLGASGQGSELILSLCKKVNAKVYLSGVSGKDYLKLDDFSSAGIQVEFQEFHHPIYRQMHLPFMPCMSIVDLLFNYGKESLQIINGVGIPVMEELFL